MSLALGSMFQLHMHLAWQLHTLLPHLGLNDLEHCYYLLGKPGLVLPHGVLVWNFTSTEFTNLTGLTVILVINLCVWVQNFTAANPGLFFFVTDLGGSRAVVVVLSLGGTQSVAVLRLILLVRQPRLQLGHDLKLLLLDLFLESA